MYWKYSDKRSKSYNKIASFLIVLGIVSIFLVPAQPAAAIGEASTLFGVFVPVSMNPERVATLVVTAVSDGTVVDITDKYSDGCQNVPGLALSAGQSYILPVLGGPANDGVGPLQEGCYFVIKSNKPVVAANETTNTDWQHAFVPADNHRGTGTSFYLYRPQGLQDSFAAGNVFDAFAFTDNTEIRVIDITTGTAVFSGTTTVVPDAQGVVVFSAIIMAGQDLLEVNQKRASLVDGHTYHILSSNDVAIQFGALGKGTVGSRDGGAYVPGKTGYSVDTVFYFVLPFEQTKEREVRIVAYDALANVTVRGWNTISRTFDTITSTVLSPYDHVEWIGSDLGVYSDTNAATGSSGYYFFQVTTDQPISVFESNWIETGSYGTSDTATYISAKEGTGAGTYFQTYMDPPGMHPYTTTMLSHLIVSTYHTATVTVADSDSFGEYIELYNNTNQSVDLTDWKVTNSAGQTVFLPTGSTIPSGGVYLLQYHARSTGATADYVYGDTTGDFRIKNKADNLSLYNGASLIDSVVYTDTNWGNHGVIYAMERANPNQPFTSLNVRDSAQFNAANASNIGSFYGSPGVANGASGSLTGSVVINEVMTGRFYRSFTIPQYSYHDVTLDSDQWMELHNGSAPGVLSNLAHPENPYLIIESDSPVSVFNSNWDDNWMAYATGVLRPDPTLTVQLDHSSYQPSDTVTLHVVGLNKYSTLYQPVMTIILPPGLVYTGTYQTASLLAGITPTQLLLPNGSTQLTWSLSGTLGSALLSPIGPWRAPRLAPNDNSELDAEVTAKVKDDAKEGDLVEASASVSGKDDQEQSYNSNNTVVAAVTLNAAPQSTNLLINEVMTWPGCSGDQWIELYNNGGSAIQLAGFELTNHSGTLYTFPKGTPALTGNSYAVVHLSAGVDDTSGSLKQFYAGAGTLNALNQADDQVALFNSSLRIASSMLDYMRWDATSNVVNRGDLDLAISSTNWDNNNVTPAPSGQSMNRKLNSGIVADTDKKDDWVSGTPSAGLLNNPTQAAVSASAITNLLATPLITQEGSVRLTWTNPITTIDQLQIARSPITYPTKLSDGVVITSITNHATLFVDTGITNTTPVYYTAFSSRSGSTSCSTSGSKAIALAPQRTILAYEDVKGAGWSDWDTNDFVVSEDAAINISGTTVTRIETIFTAQARGAFYDHAMTLTVGLVGKSTVLVEQFTAAGALMSRKLITTSNGTVSTSIFTSTTYILPPNGGTFTSNTYTSTTRVSGPYTRVVITPTSPASNTLTTLGLPPFDPWIYVKDTKASIHLMLPGNIGNSQQVGISTSPLYQRDLPLAQSFAHSWNWPLEERAIWTAYPQYSAYITSGGTLNSNWFLSPNPADLWTTYKLPLAANRGVGMLAGARSTSVLAGWPQTTTGSVFASPLIVNLDISGTHNGKVLVAAAQSGDVTAWNPNGSARWTHSVGTSGVRSSPAAGDLLGEGRVAVVIGSGDGKLYAWYADTGDVVSGFPLNVGAGIKSTPALIKLPAINGLSIVFQDNAGNVHVFSPLRVEQPGWPQSTGAISDTFGSVILNSTPAVGDLDSDGTPEIVVGSTSGKVFAWHLDGTLVSVLWPRSTGDWVYGSPVIVDLNKDGHRDVIVGSGDGKLYGWTGNGLPLPGFPIDLGAPIVASPAVFDLDGDGNPEVVISTISGKVYAIHGDGTQAAGWPVDMQATTYSSVAGADINSDGYPEVIIGSYKGLYAYNHDGALISGYPKDVGDWVVSSPTVGDLNGDRMVEVAVGAFNSKVYVFREYGVAHADAIAWGDFRGNSAQTGFVALDIPALALPALYTYYMPLMSLQ